MNTLHLTPQLKDSARIACYRLDTDCGIETQYFASLRTASAYLQWAGFETKDGGVTWESAMDWCPATATLTPIYPLVRGV